MLRRAWALGPSRVWVHTCSLDGPAALRTYQRRGLTVYDERTAPGDAAGASGSSRGRERERPAALMRWLVDASNVIGSKPDGWWRDRDGAARRLIDALRRFAEEEGEDVTVVLDAGPPEWAGREGPLEVAIAPRRGRDAADDEIARLLDADPGPGLDPRRDVGRRRLPRVPARAVPRSSVPGRFGGGWGTEAGERQLRWVGRLECPLAAVRARRACVSHHSSRLQSARWAELRHLCACVVHRWRAFRQPRARTIATKLTKCTLTAANGHPLPHPAGLTFAKPYSRRVLQLTVELHGRAGAPCRRCAPKTR